MSMPKNVCLKKQLTLKNIVEQLTWQFKGLEKGIKINGLNR